MLTRRQFLLGVGGLATLAGGASYPRWVEPRWLKVSRTSVVVRPGGKGDASVLERGGLTALSTSQPGGPTAHHDPESSAVGGEARKAQPIRLLHLSDFHLSSVVSLAFIAESISLGLAQQPDVIALTGDFVTARLTQTREYTDILARLSAVAPTFACLGNHDGGRWTHRLGGSATIDAVLGLLSGAGVTCLMNEARQVVIKGRTMQFIGVGDLWSGMCNPGKAFVQTPERDGAIRVVLNHNPDAKDLLRRFDWDLMLCGHTHGGQVKLPLIGTPFLPVRDKRYVAGLYRWDNRQLYITRGVGNLHGIRFNCRPEVSVLELV